jgi:hypothetical protein
MKQRASTRSATNWNAGAFFPALIRELLEDHQMAEHGLTFDDLREILRKAENFASNKVPCGKLRRLEF